MPTCWSISLSSNKEYPLSFCMEILEHQENLEQKNFAHPVLVYTIALKTFGKYFKPSYNGFFPSQIWKLSRVIPYRCSDTMFSCSLGHLISLYQCQDYVWRSCALLYLLEQFVAVFAVEGIIVLREPVSNGKCLSKILPWDEHLNHMNYKWNMDI